MIMNSGAVCLGGELVRTVGKGVMKRLILDRVLGWQAISQCKNTTHKILIPIRRNMDLYADAMRCFNPRTLSGGMQRQEQERRSRIATTTPSAIVKRRNTAEETPAAQRTRAPAPRKGAHQKGGGRYRRVRSWSSCTIPLSVVANRSTMPMASGPLVLNRHPESEKSRADSSRISPAGLNRGTISAVKCFSDLTTLPLALSLWSSIKCLCHAGL